MGNPRAARRVWTSRTPAPRAPGLMVVIALILMPRPEPVAWGVGWLYPQGGRSGRDVRLDLPEDGVLVPGPDDPGLLLAVLEDDQGRDAHNAEPSGRLWIVVHVHLGRGHALGEVARDVLDDRRDHVAGDAPFGPEVHQDRPLGMQDLAFEVLVRNLDDVLSHVSFLPSFASRPGASGLLDPGQAQPYIQHGSRFPYSSFPG